jgi:dienelactone hydrolase/predicted Ser/Thr protein kinase
MKCPSCGIENLDDSKFCRNCATALPGGEASVTRTLIKGPAEFAAGTVIVGRYKITRILGRGGMGVVYLADDTRLKRPVALKFLPPGLALDEDIKRRFIIEARAAAALSHPNICTIHEVDDQAEKAYISMEYVEGDSLREKVAKGPLPFEHVLDIALQVLAGLDEAHKKGIVHRDIKSANIMVTAKGQAKIMDFGLAKVAGSALITKEGQTMGTVAYMSPEQARGEEVDARTDIWSLGVVLYEITSGKLPFGEDLQSAILHNIIHEEPKPLKAIVPKLPEEFERIVRRALKKQVADRYCSAAEMLADLQKFHATLQKEKAGVFNLRSFLRILRKPLVAVPIALVLIALGLVIYSIINGQANIRGARQIVLPELQRLMDEAAPLQPKEGFRMLDLYERAAAYLPDDPKVKEFFPRCVREVPIKTTPPGVRVFVKEYFFPERAWRYLGTTPIEKIRLPRIFFRWKMEKEGYETLEFAASGFSFDPIKQEDILGVERRLEPVGIFPGDMVRIPSGKTDVGILEDFFIDRYEVTNKKYKEFVERGGYHKKEYWKQPFVNNGKNLAWDEALALFVDTTGRPGPSTWRGGAYPEGHADYPVSGVSWYEAAAYAEFAGRKLPTIYHWGRAALQRVYPSWYLPFMNFGGAGPVAAGSRPSLNYYGTYDMAGNVREWCWNEAPEGRIIRGGAWDDATYMFENLSQASMFDRSSRNGFRCALYIDPQKIPKSAFQLAHVDVVPDFYKLTPVPDSVFIVYKDQFTYDKKDLNARLEWRNESAKDWVQEKITFDAAYDDERVIAYLFLPKNAKPPFQTVIYFPTSSSVFQKSSENLDKFNEFEYFLSFIVKDGRAVLFPIYKGTFERSDEKLAAIHTGDSSRLFTEYLIKLVKDISRCIDYLETRTDIGGNKIAYLGVSWGGEWGAIIPAVEERLKISILGLGGMSGEGRPEANAINYVSHVKIPTLMLNGKYDMTFPYATTVRPMFDLLGTPKSDKVLKLYDTDHFIPQNEFIKETLHWLDKYLGPVY